ncbi:hypothetical protein M0R72_06015 [Candidatus Pacearchaeota archaeon]|jgi:hypothetical protein|nr:hypothetical protein [Candidatus Pacearchaeota archaeon]
MSIIAPEKKTQLDTKGAATVINLSMKSRDVIQLGNKVKLDPIVLGNKALSHGAGLDIRLGEMRSGQKPIHVEKFLPQGNIAVRVKQDVPNDVPAPIVLTMGGKNVGPSDLGGPSNLRSTDTGDDVHKILVTDLSNIKANVLTGIQGEGGDARYATYVENANHIAYTPDGVLHVTFSNINGAVENAYHAYSPDGGQTWTVERVDDSWSGRQVYSSVAVDKNGKLYFMWAESDDSDTSRRFLRLRTKTLTGVWGSIEQASETIAGGPYNRDPCMAFEPDGETLGIVWSGQGYGSDPTGLNVLYRTRASDGTYSAVDTVTADAKSTATVIEYRRTSLQYDSNSKPHIGFNDSGTINTYYSNKVGAGWLAKEQVNTDHNNAGYVNSNVIVDTNNTFHICYLYDTGSQYDLIYKNRTSAGVWSAASTIENKVQSTQMQINVDGEITFCIPTANYAARYMLVMKTLSKGGVLSAATTIDDRVGYWILSGMTLWGNAVVRGLRNNVPQQGAVFVYTVFTASDMSSCDLVFLATPTAVIGSGSPVIMESYVTRRRGYIEVGKKELIGAPLIM